MRRGWSPGNREKIRAEGCCDEPSETAVTNSIVLRLDHLFPLMPSSTPFPFFRVPYPRLRNISPRFPTPTPNREELGLRETSPNKVEKRAVGRMGGINFSLVAPAAFGDDPGRAWGKPVRRPITDRPLALRAMHRYAGRIKEIGDTRPRQHDP